ncbi:DUF4192 domain-containing protein [Kitasatospora sp. NBC_00374]|uniref:DUF4192 domain-containing protein n=1 Tax=Kitasatospora sp. NBC_00374 TaxID=2975964 RepID=UPI00324BAD09
MTDQLQTVGPKSRPALLAARLPGLFGYFPDNCFVLCGTDQVTDEIIGMVSTELPADPTEWRWTVDESLQFLLSSTAAHDIQLNCVVGFICPDPAIPGYGAESRSTHQPLTTYLQEACLEQGVHLRDSLYVTRTLWWSALCTRPECCPTEGKPIPSGADADRGPGAPYPHRADVLADLAPATGPDATRFSDAIDRATVALHRKIHAEGNQGVVDDGLDLIASTVRSLMDPATRADMDDDLAAQLVLLLQYSDVRNRAMHYVKPEEVDAVRSLWRTLARFPVEPYDEYRATPLALYGLTAWAQGEHGVACIAIQTADGIEPDNRLVALLSRLIGVEPDFEPVRTSLLDHRAGCHAAA